MKLKSILEANRDGTISKGETDKQQAMLKKFKGDLTKIFKKYASDADKLGGRFRSPGYREQLRLAAKSLTEKMFKK